MTACASPAPRARRPSTARAARTRRLATSGAPARRRQQRRASSRSRNLQDGKLNQHGNAIHGQQVRHGPPTRQGHLQAFYMARATQISPRPKAKTSYQSQDKGLVTAVWQTGYHGMANAFVRDRSPRWLSSSSIPTMPESLGLPLVGRRHRALQRLRLDLRDGLSRAINEEESNVRPVYRLLDGIGRQCDDAVDDGPGTSSRTKGNMGEHSPGPKSNSHKFQEQQQRQRIAASLERALQDEEGRGSSS